MKFVVSLIVVSLLCMSGVTIYTTYKASRPVIKVEQVKRPSLIWSCAHLLIPVDEDEWDEEKQSYPPNHAWGDCMGVGRK